MVNEYRDGALGWQQMHRVRDHLSQSIEGWIGISSAGIVGVIHCCDVVHQRRYLKEFQGRRVEAPAGLLTFTSAFYELLLDMEY